VKSNFSLSGYQKKNWKNDKYEKGGFQKNDKKYGSKTDSNYVPGPKGKYENKYEPKFETIYEPKVKTEAPKTETVKTEVQISTASQPFVPKQDYSKPEYKADPKYEPRNDSKRFNQI
jgi:hypothetical protein